MIYFDNAATTLRKPPEVIEAVSRAMTTLGNAGRGANDAALDASRSIFGARSLLAQFFHAESPERIAFTANATESLNIAIRGVLRPGDHVISTVCEHNSVLRPLFDLEEAGVELTLLSADSLGRLRLEELLPALRPNTRALVMAQGSNLTGNIHDIASAGAIARERGLVFIVDAAQTAGLCDLDVQAMNIDILCFTGHKGLLGPQGTGGLYVRPGITVRPLKTGGSGIRTFDRRHPEEMPTALEAGTLNGHGIAGLAAAVDYIKRMGLDRIRESELALARRFAEGITGLPGVTLYGDLQAPLRCPIVSMNLWDLDSAELGDLLARDYGICIRSGGHCAPLMHEALGTRNRGAVRFSFSHTNSAEEVDEAIQAIAELSADFA